MKAVVIKSHVKDAVYAVAGASTENQNLPILRNVFLEAKDGKIIARATNLEIAITHTIPGKVMEDGVITVPVGTFLQLITNLGSERVNLEAKNNVLNVKTDNYEATLQGVSPDDFPLIPAIKNERGTIKIKGVLLKEGLAQVMIAAQPSELRPELGSVLFHFTLDALKLAATDSFRLAEKTFGKNQFSASYEEATKLLIPLKTIQELVKIINDDEDVVIKDDGNQILFETPTFSLISRLIDGRFPDYEAILPKKFETEIVIESQEFIDAIKLSAVFGSKGNEVKVKMLENKKSVQVYSAEQGLGENASVLSARAEGSPCDVSFNWRYLLDGLRAIKGKEISLGVNDETKPALLRAPNEASYFYIVMPILKG